MQAEATPALNSVMPTVDSLSGIDMHNMHSNCCTLIQLLYIAITEIDYHSKPTSTPSTGQERDTGKQDQ